MSTNFLAKSEILINASRARVWAALTDPATIPRYMFGARVETDWKVGGPISWKGEWEGRPFEDKGKILRLEPEVALVFTHASGMSPDRVHHVTFALGDKDGATSVEILQNGSLNKEEQAHSQRNWDAMLEGCDAGRIEEGRGGKSRLGRGIG
jgi:uncharacterized protein YndB with AHSA1/START domain